MSKHACLFLLLLTIVSVGCSQSTTESEANSVAAIDSATIDLVCKLAAKQTGVDASKVKPSTSLADIGADELDFVELVMTLEDEFNRLISDDALAKVTGSADLNTGHGKLTMTKLAELVVD